MPRPTKTTEAPSVCKSHNLAHPQGHVIIIYADYAVWDETAGKFIDYVEDLKRV